MPIGDIELKELRQDMGFSPALLKLIYESHPKLFDTIYNMDKTLLSDGALSAKTKRLIALAVVATQGCEACATAQMKVAMNMGASRPRCNCWHAGRRNSSRSAQKVLRTSGGGLGRRVAELPIPSVSKDA
jgi:AhpD family alkylhydroperoxidase